MDRTPAPRAFWQHPLWWVALIALALNDHLLKGSAAPAALTGKLSDFAGLLVAPPLFAYLLARAQVPRARPLGWAAVVGVFAGINLSPGFARLVEGALGWQIWVDPTDLVALPMAALAWRLFASRGRFLRGAAACRVMWISSSLRPSWSVTKVPPVSTARSSRYGIFRFPKLWLQRRLQANCGKRSPRRRHIWPSRELLWLRYRRAIRQSFFWRSRCSS